MQNSDSCHERLVIYSSFRATNLLIIWPLVALSWSYLDGYLCQLFLCIAFIFCLMFG